MTNYRGADKARQIHRNLSNTLGSKYETNWDHMTACAEDYTDRKFSSKARPRLSDVIECGFQDAKLWKSIIRTYCILTNSLIPLPAIAVI